MTSPLYDAIIIGGGPAGMSAALTLGRCRRRVVICDSGSPRNARSHGIHCLLTHEGILPSEFRALAHADLARYDVEWRDQGVVDALHDGALFDVVLADGARLGSRTLLIATGVRDKVPQIEGIDDLYGISVHHCPYCDGWEWRDRPLAVYGRGTRGLGLALSLRTWSDDVILCTDGGSRLDPDQRGRLKRHGIPIRTERIGRLEGTGGLLEGIRFKNGELLARSALFFNTGQEQRCGFAGRLGCTFTEKGAVWSTRRGETGVPGLYVAGDAARDAQLVIVAAAEGAKAAVAINTFLQREERK
jgi:thioredoxin reductase